MRRRPVGQILVEQGEISEADLEAALAEQERSGRRLGEILIEQGRTSWLALARAIAEQVLDIQNSRAVPEPRPGPESEPAPRAEPAPDPVKMVRELAERVASLPPVPDPVPQPAPTPAQEAEHELARAVAEQVANLDTPAPQQPQPQEARLLHLTPAPQPTPSPAAVPDDDRLMSVEALLRERQRAFIELVTTAETLRMKVARLEEILEERDRELAKLRIARAV
jgi:hypothetical protein